MISTMKKCSRICLITALCLLLPAQALFAAPEETAPGKPEAASLEARPHTPEDTTPGKPEAASLATRLHTPLDTALSIVAQVRDAAKKIEEERVRQEQQMAQLKEVMEEQLEILLTQPESLPEGPLFPGFSGDTGTGSGESETEAAEETDLAAETETETESETELPEETETEFHPLEMGASLPDTGTQPNETAPESGDGTPGQENAPETEPPETPPTEEGTGEIDDSVMLSRHGTFAVPMVSGLNKARLNLYDYRILREYPLSRLPKDLHILYRQLKEQVGAYDGTWSVYVQNLTTGQALVVNDSPMRSASVMKLFIMETVYEAFDRGDLPRNEDNVYLLRNMIINSSNDSSNRLLSLLGDGDIATGIARVNEFISLRGFSGGTTCYNGFQDPAASVNPSHPNIIMAKDVGLLLSRVYNRAFISRKVCNEIEQMMLEQATRYKIPRGLPEGVECGNKSGETDTIANDAAVIYGPTTDYILVVLSNDWSNEDTANAEIAEVSTAVYSFFEH